MFSKTTAGLSQAHSRQLPHKRFVQSSIESSGYSSLSKSMYSSQCWDNIHYC